MVAEEGWPKRAGRRGVAEEGWPKRTGRRGLAEEGGRRGSLAEEGVPRVRGSPERDMLFLRAFGPRGRQVLRVVRVARALFDVFEEE